MYHYTCILHAVEFATGASRKPLRVEITGLPWTQPDESCIDLGLQIIRRFTLVPGSQGRHAVGIQLQFGAIRPKNNRCLARIGFVLLVSEALDHGIPTIAI